MQWHSSSRRNRNMKTVKTFEEFLKIGIIRKQKTDTSKANFLTVEAEKSYNFIKKIVASLGITEQSASTITKSSYDIIMELTRAHMLKNGFKSSGYSAHEAEISYLRKLKLSETEMQFANSLRHTRNQIIYYGQKLNANYAKETFDFLNKIYPKLI